MEDLKTFAKESGSPEANDLTHWDLTFWSERLRESKYDVNEVWFFLSCKHLNIFCKLKVRVPFTDSSLFHFFSPIPLDM